MHACKWTIIGHCKFYWRFLKLLFSFLALLDYVSRAHEIAICPSSVRRPSVRPSVSQLSLNLMHGFLSNFICGFPWAIRSDIFWIFEKKFFLDFLWIFFVFVNMGPYGSENLKTLLLLQIAAKSFQTFPEFSPQWSSQNYVWDFWNFEFLIFNDFFSKISNSP